MHQLGLTPDFIACRGKQPLDSSAKRKIAIFSSVPQNAIISIHDVSNIFRVPLMMMEQNMASMLVHRFRIKPFYKRNTSQEYAAYGDHDITNIAKSQLIKEWTALADSVDSPEGECVIAIVGKCVDQGDACKYRFSNSRFRGILFPSANQLYPNRSLCRKGIDSATKQRLRIEWIVASDLDINDENTSKEAYDDAWFTLRKCDGVVVPGGFGMRGFEGKVEAIKYARTSKTPFLGICLGLIVPSSKMIWRKMWRTQLFLCQKATGREWEVR